MTHECRFQGECLGTCPRCESELRYLEKQLAARAAAGKRIAIAALCAGMAFGAAGCSSPFAPKEKPVETDLSGAIDIAGGMSEPIDEGNEAVSPEDIEEVELSGDVAYIGETASE